MNDARVFSLESRVEQEENLRIQEYSFLKDTLKKVAYSLEQLGVQQLDKNVTLPRLLQSP